MKAVDTNILVYAHREDCAFHSKALAVMQELADGNSSWAIPWPCVHEFLAVVTHPKIYSPPTPLATALAAMRVWIESPMCEMIGEGPECFPVLERLSSAAKLCGPMIHDARIAAICQHNGISALLSCDRDFSRFPQLKTINPLT